MSLFPESRNYRCICSKCGFEQMVGSYPPGPDKKWLEYITCNSCNKKGTLVHNNTDIFGEPDQR